MIKSTFKLVAAIILFASCSQAEKAPSGMTYKITHASSNEKLIKNGQILKFNLEYKIKSKDSIFMTTANQMPGYIQYDSAKFATAKYVFQEIVGKLRKGDKVEFSLSVDSLVKQGQVPAYDNMFVKGDVILGKLEVVDVFANAEMVNADQLKEEAKYKEKLSKPIKDFLAKNKITAKETPEGVFVVIKNMGDTTNKVDTSKQVTVNYKGYHLNGEVFDTNIKPGDSTAKPFPVRIFESQVIGGWHYGLLNFAKGGTGTLYIPSYLAYGQQGNDKIKPNECIAFDIEVVDVKKKEALPQQGMPMPQSNDARQKANPAQKK
jgi:FKBP-type peptidyl-prolyl cis-trans isomerase